MTWERIEKQEFVCKVLKSHIEENKLSTTYLFTGAKEEDQVALAKVFAAALNCDEGDPLEPCMCLSCRKVDGGQHPDILWVGDEDVKSLKIEEVREVIKSAYLKPYEGKWKVFILIGADRLTLEASNALLKTLEEPPAKTVFCLLAQNRAQLLETIQSRAFELRLRTLGEQDEEEDGLDLAIADMTPGAWEEFLEDYQELKGEERKKFFKALMRYFRDQIRKSQGYRLGAMLHALDSIYETQEALESNANQKIAFTRLAMKLKEAV